MIVILKLVNKSLHLLLISNSETRTILDKGRLTPNNIAAKVAVCTDKEYIGFGIFETDQTAK